MKSHKKQVYTTQQFCHEKLTIMKAS